MINSHPFRISLNHHISVNEVTFGLNGNDPGSKEQYYLCVFAWVWWCQSCFQCYCWPCRCKCCPNVLQSPPLWLSFEWPLPLGKFCFPVWKIEKFSFLVCLMMRRNETLTHCWLFSITGVVSSMFLLMYHCTSGGSFLVMSMGKRILHSRVWGSPEIGTKRRPQLTSNPFSEHNQTLLRCDSYQGPLPLCCFHQDTRWAEGDSVCNRLLRYVESSYTAPELRLWRWG